MLPVGLLERKRATAARQLDEICANYSTHQLGGIHNSCGEDNNVIKRIKWSVIKFRPRIYEQVELPESGRKKYSYLRACADGIS